MKAVIIAPFIALACLLFAGCQHRAQPQTIAYDTLRQAANALDAKMALYDVEVAEGKVSPEDQAKVVAAFNQANDALIAAAKVAKLGFDDEPPADTAALVQAAVDLITTIIPPKPQE